MRRSQPQFWKPDSERPGVSLQLERVSDGIGAGSFISYNQNLSASIQQQRQRLPVAKYKNHILHMLENYQTLIIVGETGSGKSTQIPQYLLEAGWTEDEKIIGITQPRRVAATTVANRVAEEMGTFVGQEVGYSIRFDDCTDKQLTKIKFMTDGYLVREMMGDPLLTNYSVLMLDEAHERTLYTDVAIGLLKKILKRRKDLRVIVSSATLDAETYRDFFNLNSTDDRGKDTAAILSVEGRMFSVDIFYLQSPVPDYVKSSVETVFSIHKEEADGDILVFLTGQDEVEKAVSMIRDSESLTNKRKIKLTALPIYGGLPIGEQLKVFQRTPWNTRKVVVATNIAEASITINGIVYVVDCGFVKLKAYNPKAGIESLVVVPTSQAAATQRAGRAGRMRSGKCFRLYQEDSFVAMDSSTCPEMQRSDMAPVILLLKTLGVDNVLRFSFLSRPPAQSMARGLELLFALGALDDAGDLTDPLGLQMAEFPLNPMFSKMLLISGEFGCSEEAVTIAAMAQLENVFSSPSNQKRKSEIAKLRFATLEGDHLTLLNVYRAFIKHNKESRWCYTNFLNHKALMHAVKIRDQLVKLLRRFNIPMVSCDDDDEKIRRCITAGFFANAAKYHPSGEYRTVRDDYALHLHPQSVLITVNPPKWVVFGQVLCTSKDYMRDVTVIESPWLYELAPHYYEYGTERSVMSKRARIET